MKKVDLSNMLDSWINQQRLDEYSQKTLVDYKHAIQLFIDYIPTNNFEINKELTLDYKQNYLANTFSLNSRNKYITVLNKFLKYYDFKDSTLKKFKTQKKTSINDPIWEQEHKRMLRWAKKLDMEDMYWIMQAFAHAGIRVVELKVFTVENLEGNFINVFNKGKERTIILVNDLKRGLKQYCKSKGITSGYIFRSPIEPNNPNKMIHITTIWRRLKKIAKAAKINPNKIHPHAWRHLFAKKAKEVGIDLDELQDIFGHADLKTTAIYTMTSNIEKKSKMEKMKYGRK